MQRRGYGPFDEEAGEVKAVVIGAGVGGLCVAIRLATAGHDVAVYERNAHVGGKLARLVEGGYTFDLGPTLFTMPQLYDEVFRLAGSSLAAELDVRRLDPQFQYRWPDGSTVEIPDDARATPHALDAFSPGTGQAWASFASHTADIWDVAERTFLAGEVRSPWSLVSRSRRPLDLKRVDGTRTLAKAARQQFDDPRLHQLVGRYATYSGSSPFETPATLSCISHVEQAFGCWHIMGGLAALGAALRRAAEQVGVEFHLGADVGRVLAASGAVTGIELSDGGEVNADIVVSDVDAAHLYRDLLPDVKQAKALDKAGRSMSAFVMCAAVRGRTDDIAHHMVFFPLDEQREYRSLAARQMPIDPTVYACVSSVTDSSMAPRDHENWMFLVNTPSAIGLDRKLQSAAILNRLAERGIELRDRIDFTRTLVPADFEARYRAVDGAIYGTSSNGRTAAFQRPGNTGAIDGLFLVGGSTHPGGGLPMVATSARIVADLIE